MLFIMLCYVHADKRLHKVKGFKLVIFLQEFKPHCSYKIVLIKNEPITTAADLHGNVSINWMNTCSNLFKYYITYTFFT